MISRKAVLLATVAWTVSAAIEPLARAQSANAPPQAGSSAPAAPATGTVAPAAQPGRIEEVVVTAQKRSERLQKVPFAITALSGKALEQQHITNPNDLTRVVPDVLVNSGGAAGDSGSSQTVFSIRGLGASGQGLLGSPAVAVHLDGHYEQTGLATNEFFDVQRIEVSPGPQGTLYGRSAAAGAINVITNKPTSELGGDAGLELGNYGEVRGFGAINVPLDNTLSLRVSGQYQSHNGYFSNGFDDLDSGAIRGQVLWKPDDKLSVRVSTQYLHNGGLGASPVFVGPNAAPLGLSGDVFGRSIAQNAYVDGKLQHVTANVNDTKIDVLGEIAYDFGPTILTIAPTFEHFVNDNTNNPLSGPYSSYSISGPADQKSVEVRFNDPGTTKLKWVVGGSYFTYDTDAVILPSVVPSPFTPVRLGPFSGPIEANGVDDDDVARQNSTAVFGQATYPVLDHLRLTLGARQNWDESTYRGRLGELGVFVGQSPNLLDPPFGRGPSITPELMANASFRETSWKAAVDYDLGPESLVYGTVGRGYKPGGLNESGPPSSNPAPSPFAPSQVFQPEIVTHYEIGSKNRFFGDRLQINDAVYFDNYKNYQNLNNELVNPLADGAVGAVVTNAGRAHVYGNELSAEYQATSNDHFSAAVNYLHARFVSYLLPAYLSAGGMPEPAESFSGYVLPNAPKWSGTFTYSHRFLLPGESSITALASTYLTTSYYAYFQEQEGTRQGAYTKTFLSLTYLPPRQDYSVSVFVKNLENKADLIAASYTAPFPYVYYDAPRLYGITVTKHF